MLNAEDPVVAAYAGLGTAPAVATAATRRCRAGSASSTAGSSRPASSACPSPAAARRRPGPTAGSAGRRARHPRRPQRLATPSRRSPSASCSGSRPTRSAAAAAAFTGVEHRLEPVAPVDGVRFVNDSQGTQPDAVIAAACAPSTAPVVLIAGGRDKGVDLPALRRSSRERAVPRPSDRRERAGPRGAGSAPPGWRHVERAGTSRRPSCAPMRSPRGRASATGRARRTRDRAAQPGRRQLRHVRRLRGPRTGLQGRPWPTSPPPAPQEEGPMNLAPPPRRAPPDGAPRRARSPAGTPYARQPVAGEVPRRHAPARAPPARLHDPRRRSSPSPRSAS